MYARYIPPSRPKSGGPLAEESRAAAVDSRSVPAATGSFSYARYVPSSTSPAAHRDHSDLNTNLSFKFDESEPTKDNEKKNTIKEKKKRRREGDGDDGKAENRRTKKRKELEDEEHSSRASCFQERSGSSKKEIEETKAKKDKDKKDKKSKKDKDMKREKKTRGDTELEDDAEEVQNETVQNGVSGVGQGYKSDESLREGIPSSETYKEKEKKGEKKDRKKTTMDGSEDITTTNQIDESGGGRDHGKRESRGNKEKKETKRKRKHRNAQHDAVEIDEDAPSRHKSILEKKERSFKRALLEPIEDEKKHMKGDENDEAARDLPTHGLEPLPQPEPVNFDATQPGFEALPAWIANPIRVTDDSRASFTALGFPDRAAKGLATKGFREAFAVQTAAIPLLLPTATRIQGDVLISAATGSGKTLACAIPIVWDICQGLVTRLRAVIVLPTRELANQAKDVFESCASAFDASARKKVKIGIAHGSQSLKQEQGTLIARQERYDPDAIKALDSASKDDESESESDAGRSVIRGSLPNHVVEFESTVDVLICTPGRLVDHIKQTQGFSMKYVRWLVVDEGDKLLEQAYQGWTDIVRDRLRLDDGDISQGSEERIMGARDFPNSNYSGVRKIVLSATLTKHGSLAAIRELDLRKPTLIVLGGGDEGSEHVLPTTLKEGTLRFRDENLKPLYLHELLMSHHLKKAAGGSAPAQETAAPSPTPEPSDSEDKPSEDANIPIEYTALVFTKSNESALRLSRLLALLNPSLGPLIGTLTSATRPHVRRKTIASFLSRRVRLLVASDLVARGIDLPHLDHVVNYDLPASVEAYVHRVGRTERAGMDGSAWTLLPDGKESGWFWGEVAKGKKIVRSHKVERISVGNNNSMPKEKVETYERALEELGKEARGGY